jgi:hypothetical protein
MTNYMRLVHKADIYEKSTTRNAAGQAKATWASETADVKCYFVPRFAETRVQPTYEQWERINIFFNADAGVDYNKRIYNIRDRVGNVIEAGPLEVISVIKQSGFSGKVRHVMVTVQRVIET